MAESFAWKIRRQNISPWRSSSTNRILSSGRSSFHRRIGMLRARDAAPCGLGEPELPTPLFNPFAPPFDDRNSSKNSGVNKTRDSVRVGGRSDEVSDEGHASIARVARERFDLLAA